MCQRIKVKILHVKEMLQPHPIHLFRCQLMKVPKNWKCALRCCNPTSFNPLCANLTESVPIDDAPRTNVPMNQTR